MNKKLLLSALSLLVLSTTINSCMAQDVECPEKQVPPMEFKHHKMPPKHFKGMPPRGEFHKHKFSPEHKAKMEAKKAEFEKRLNLTEEQKQTIEANKIKDREKMAPIMKEIKEKQQAFMAIDKTKLTEKHKQEEKQRIKAEIKELKAQADKYRQENMKNFENILTPAQKKEFEKIKKEQKTEMEKRRLEHIEKMEKFHKDRLKELQEAKKNPPKF